MSLARPTIEPLRIVPARTKLTASSEDVTSDPAGAAVNTALARARSATKAIEPAKNTPAPDCHQRLAGIAALATPGPLSVRRRPVSFVSGGSGSARSTLARMISRPVFARTSGPQSSPLGASRSMIGAIASLTGRNEASTYRPQHDLQQIEAGVGDTEGLARRRCRTTQHRAHFGGVGLRCPRAREPRLS